METKHKIETSDGHVIYGTLTLSKKPSQKLIIFVHGLTGHQNESMFYNGSKFFSSKGFNVFRFDQYCGEKDARRFIDTTTEIHAKDLNAVVKLFSQKYDQIYLVGHSWGGPVILSSDLSKITALILWDPSPSGELIKDCEELRYEPKLNAYILDWGIRQILGKAWFESAQKLPSVEDLGSKCNKPIKIIAAERGTEGKSKILLKKIDCLKSYVCVKRADHCFHVEGTQDQLFKETLDWLKKF
ncbi:MAG: alpha/beta fold hydrolase [Candidatus Vogelbacteria bacterium]|nr:alpha/beta fold hydrolase [Candidatus Vogelbacteria bacterium]